MGFNKSKKQEKSKMNKQVKKEENIIQEEYEVNYTEISTPFFHSFKENLPLSNIYSSPEIGELFISTRSGRISSLKRMKKYISKSSGTTLMDSGIKEKSFKCGKKVYCVCIWENFVMVGTYSGEIERITLKGDLICTIKGHNNRIYELKVFNGTLYSCSKDCIIAAWNKDLTLIDSVSDHKKSVRCMEMLDKNSFISAGNEKLVYLWKINPLQNPIYTLHKVSSQQHDTSIL